MTRSGNGPNSIQFGWSRVRCRIRFSETYNNVLFILRRHSHPYDLFPRRTQLQSCKKMGTAQVQVTRSRFKQKSYNYNRTAKHPRITQRRVKLHLMWKKPGPTQYHAKVVSQYGIKMTFR